jgi:uncharacterized membrane protein
MEMNMRRLTTGLLLATLGLSGCAKESKPGGPGAAPRTGTERSYQTPDDRTDTNKAVDTDNKSVDSASTFTLKTTLGDVDLKRGERKEITVSIDRGSKFNQQVELQLKAPSGIKVTPDTVTIPTSATEAKVTIEAEENAPAGKASIDVTGTPASGRATSLKVPVEVHAD